VQVSEKVFAVMLATVRPIVSMLIRFGVSYQDFDLVVRSAFVEAATRLGAEGSKRPNTSQISLATGLSRKTVRLVQERSLAVKLPQPEIRSLQADLLTTWHTDPRFMVRHGVPRDLVWEGESDSFCELVRVCSSDTSPSAMRDELLQVGAIVETDSGLLRATRRSFIPGTREGRLIQGFQYGLRPLALTIAYNTAPEHSSDLRFQRLVWNYCMPKSQRAAMDGLIRKRLEEFSEEVDDLISEVGASADMSEGSVFGVGLYHFEDDPTNITG